jgi:hypothetical protein
MNYMNTRGDHSWRSDTSDNTLARLQIIWRDAIYSYPAKLQDSFIMGIDPIDPITPKSEGDDLVFKTTPKFFL